MKNFLRICRFEQKKLLQKAYIRAAIGLILILTLALNIYPLLQETEIAYLDDDGNVVIETVNQVQAAALERKFSEPYDGTLLTDDVAVSIQELNLAYLDKTKTEENGNLPLLNTYLPFTSLRGFGFNPNYVTEKPAEMGYQILREDQIGYVQNEWENQFISDQELEYWTEIIEETELPMTMYYADGYVAIIRKSYWLGLLGIGFAILCLCPVFSEETACRTDSLIRTSRCGDRKVSAAKLAAGEAAAAGMVLLLYGITAAIQFAVHGTGGAEALIQMQYFRLDLQYGAMIAPLTVGQVLVILLAVSLFLSLAAGGLTMLLSRLLGSTVPALAAPFCVVLLPYIIDYYIGGSAAEKILSYFPLQRLRLEDFLIDVRMTSFFGVTLTAMQTSLLLYSGLAAALLTLCAILCRITAVERQ